MTRPFLIVVVMTLSFAVLGAEFVAWYVAKPTESAEVKIGGEFTMTNHNGQTVTNEDFEGKPMIVFFGFTYCPDICPTTLSRLSSSLDKLGSDAEKVNVLLVSVDPERDTPGALGQYLQSFHKRITGLTGSPDQLAAFAKNYKAYYKKVATADGGYTMDHTAAILMFDSAGRFTGTLNKDGDEAVAVHQLRELIDA